MKNDNLDKYLATFETQALHADIDMNDHTNLRTFTLRLPQSLTDACIKMENPETYEQWRATVQCQQKIYLKTKSLLSRMESVTSCIQRIPNPSPPKAAPKLKYSHVVEPTLRPCDPGKLSPDLSRVRSRDILTTLGSCDIQARDPGKVSHDLPRDWSSTQSQVTTRLPD